MTSRTVLRKIRRRTLEAFNRREFNLNGSGPKISFTFDDFPRSALRIGGSVLKSYGVCGTYYVSMGLIDQVNGLGRQFSAADLADLLRDGHEIGSHTFGHLSCRSSSLKDFEADVIKGKRAVEQITGRDVPHLFSYPYGHAALRSKRRVGKVFSSCRGIIPGINESPVDLNLLRANSLYSGSFDLKAIGSLFEANMRCNGWLIFYTHDISGNPSPFGCRPGEFESVVKLAVESQAAILPVGQISLGKSC